MRRFLRVAVGSDRGSELIKGRSDSKILVACFDAEFVVAPPQVLNKRMTGDHDRRRPVGSQAAHRSKSRLETPMVTLDPIVGVLTGVMVSVSQQLLDNAQQRRGQVGSDLSRPTVIGERRGEESRRCGGVAPLRYVDVDDLAVLVNGAITVTDTSSGVTKSPSTAAGAAGSTTSVHVPPPSPATSFREPTS